MGERVGRWTSWRRLSPAAVRVWRSPEAQPPWARPALLAIAAAAALSYAWGMNGAALASFYGAAARSMSASWHDFFFGAFDPAGTVTVDKLPGALWPQALSLRIFGFHVWAAVLPQVIEGVLTVLALYRAVHRMAGPVAGIVAAAALAASPVTVALNRGNVSDSLLILLTVLAADATCAALVSGRVRSLLVAGVWVGLAFQAKMGQAWLILPALAAAYLLAAPARRLRERALHVAMAGVVTVVVSLSWMTAVSLVPRGDRPYVDGTQNDSVFSQVFDYNGIARLHHGTSVAGAGHTAAFLRRRAQGAGSANNVAEHVAPSWHRLLDGIYGRDIAWLLPAALIALAGVLLARRASGRSDPLRAAALLWAVWLAILWVAFSDGIYLHSYYVAALAPALAALCGLGAAVAWERREDLRVGRALVGTLALSIAYGVFLLRDGVGVPGWLTPTAIALGVGSASWVLVAIARPRASERASGRDSIALATGLAPPSGALFAFVLLLPAIASVSMVTRGLGPFAAPFEPASATESRAEAKHASDVSAQIVEAVSGEYESQWAFAIDTSQLAAPYIQATGEEVLPIGGFEGGAPAPTVAQLRSYVSAGKVRAFLVPAGETDERLRWIYSHCKRTEATTGGRVPLLLYDCEGAS